MSDSGGFSTHLELGGNDRTLITVGPIGGHGGPPYGPLAQLEFSADGSYLLDYAQFIPRPGPPQFAVYRTDGSMAFQSDRAEFGAWAPRGATIFFLVTQQPGGDVKGDLHSWDPSAGERILARGLTSYFWPRTAPDGKTVAFNAYDTTAPGEASGGLPHLWRLDLGTAAVAQLSLAISTRPLFVGPAVIWSDEEQRCSCGPGGASAGTGRVTAHDLASGHDVGVDISQFALGPDPLNAVLDVWIG